MSSATKQYYDSHAADYFNQTVSADMSHLYDRFLENIPEGGSILDVGCGSGRDLLAFSLRGFKAQGIDSSGTLARMASAYSGVPVNVGDFSTMKINGQYDGIWACASLLHVEREFLSDTLKNLKAAMIPGGVIFASVREGAGQRAGDDGRVYTLFYIEELKEIFAKSGLQVQLAWKTQDVIHSRSKLTWINVMAMNPPSQT